MSITISDTWQLGVVQRVLTGGVECEFGMRYVAKDEKPCGALPGMVFQVVFQLIAASFPVSFLVFLSEYGSAFW